MHNQTIHRFYFIEEANKDNYCNVFKFSYVFFKYETNKIIIIHPSKINKINIVDYVSCSYYLQEIKGYLMMIRVRTTAFPLPIFPFIYNIYLIKEKEIIVKRKTECRMSYMDSMEHDI